MHCHHLLGPIIWNLAVLLVLFMVLLFLGPMLDMCCEEFGAVIASIAQFLAVVGIIVFGEFLGCDWRCSLSSFLL